MTRELYCQLPTDLDYEPKVETQEVFQLLQQVRFVLGTKPGEVLGTPMFGCDLEKYLFRMNLNKEEILTAIRQEIIEYVYYDSNKWELSIDVMFGKNADDPYEYALIDISINEKKCLGIIVNQQ